MMKDNIEVSQSHIKSLESLIASLSKKVKTGDKEILVKQAWAIAIHKFLKGGNRLTDLSWFKYTKYYTGKKDIDKAA